MPTSAYGVDEIVERHRHRYEFNKFYRDILEQRGLIAAGMSPDGSLVEISELRDHPFMLGSQFHPELRSRPNRPHPLFRDFVAAAAGVLPERPFRTAELTSGLAPMAGATAG